MREGVTFTDLKEANDYQSSMRKQGIVTKRIKISGGYRVIPIGEAPEWKNSKRLENISDALKNEDKLS